MPVLYRDYRPQSFADIINQSHIKTTLQNAVAKGGFAHAYLFTGPRGTGKTSTARIFARAVNCPNQKKGEPCNNCDICKQFIEGKGLDLIEIDAASNTGVENVRELIETLRFSPSQAKYKVFIIDEVHMLSKGAFNALLKTLEEPPAHAIFILATTEVHKVPATVASRTQRFDFKKIDHQQMLDHLKEIARKEKIDLDDESLMLVANSAEGSMRDALSILDKLSQVGKANLTEVEQLLGITNVTAVQKFLDLLAARDAAGSLQFLEQVFSSGIDPVQFNKDFLEYLRKVLMFSTGAQQNFALDQHQMKALAYHAEHIPQQQLLHIIRLFLRANKDFETSPGFELPVEIAAAEACLGSVQASASHAGMQHGVARNVGSFADTPAAPSAPVQKSSPNLKKSEVMAEDSVRSIKLDKSEDRFEGQQQMTQKSVTRVDLKPVSIEELRSAWDAVLKKIHDRQSTLLAVMKTMRLKEIGTGNVVVLATDYQFHRDNLDSLKNKGVLLAVLEEHFKTGFEVRVVHEKESRGEGADVSSMALEAFGGELM